MELLEEMKLTQLGIDVLERIFRNLSFGDLVSAADSNKQLRKVADLVFRLEHGRKNILIYGASSCPSHWVIDDDFFFVAHLKTTFQMLRCFGHSISKLDINLKKFGDRSKYAGNLESLGIHFDHLISYVKQYCVESLIELKILGPAGCSLNAFVRPFPNVIDVSVHLSDLTDVSLIELFPKMRSLTYHCQKITDFVKIEKEFYSLEHLEIVVENVWDREEPFSSLIRTNRRLTSLAVPFKAIFQNMNEILPNLRVLRLNEFPMVFSIEDVLYPNFYTEKFHFQTVKKIEIFHHRRFSWIPFSFDKLEELILNFNYTNYLKYQHDQLYNFLSEHPSILKLKIHNCHGVDLLKLMSMSMLPLIEEFEVCADFQMNDVIRFMNKRKTLKKIEVYLINENYSNINIVDMQMRLHEKWHGVKLNDRIGPYRFTRY